VQVPYQQFFGIEHGASSYAELGPFSEKSRVHLAACYDSSLRWVIGGCVTSARESRKD
jgi:hypothetical protein